MPDPTPTAAAERPRPLMGAAARLVLCLAVLLPLSACGAGLIGGITASSGGGGNSEPPAPGLSIATLLPLVPTPNTVRTVVLTNAQVPVQSQLEVRLEANGVTVAQQSPTASAQVGSTLVSFVVETGPILATIADPTAADVAARLSVLANGRLLAPPVSLLLARQPTVVLQLENGQAERFLAPTGERIDLRVDGLRAASVDDLQVLVSTPDPAGGVGDDGQRATITRFGTDLVLGGGAAPGLSVTLPGSPFPTAARIVVRDAVAGQSTAITNAYYRPDIALALPGQGSATGGSLLTLIGTALVPYAMVGTAPASFDFGAVSLSFSKGGRQVTLDPADFRADESDSDRLVFTMPPSPDSRPGQVDIVLDVALGGATARVTASQVFLYANPDPFFGPRGVVLDRLPVAVAPILLDNAPSTEDAPDFAALTDRGGVAFLQLLVAQQNGMFQPFGAPVQIGDHEVQAERIPRDLCVGDFDGDDVPDVLIVNEGSGGAGAVHHLVLGQRKPLPPLGAVHSFAASFGARYCRAADFDGDGLTDLLLVPATSAGPGARPEVWLSRSTAAGAPAFAAPIPLQVRDFAYEAVEVADLDGDGALDVAVVSGTALQLDVCYGGGDGTFAAGVASDPTIPGYTPAPGSPAVGLHGCQDGQQQSLCLVLAGLSPAPPTRPAIAVLPQLVDRSFGDAASAFLSPTDPIGVSLAANLDGAGPIELVVALAGEPAFGSLALLQQSGTGFVPIAGLETGAESPRQVRALVFDRAFPASGPSGEARAVYIVHEAEVDGSREKRLSTRLVVENLPLLSPPDAGAPIGFAIQNIVGGNFHDISIAGAGAVRDFAVVRADAGGEEVGLVANDGFGGFPKLSDWVEVPGVLPSSLTLVPDPLGGVDALVCCDRQSRLSWWVHDLPLPTRTDPELQVVDHVTVELRSLLPEPLASTELDDDTRIAAADVDGDGLQDLVLMLSFATSSPGAGDTQLCLLRGIAAPGVGAFPFALPTTMTAAHGNAKSFAVGDFVVADAGEPQRLELALAVPSGSAPGSVDGDHVRFYRFQAADGSGGDRFEPSASAGGPQVLIVGSEPTRLQAADFDRDGTVDLLAACRGDNTLRLFRNTRLLPHDEVDVGAFVEAFASPAPIAVGDPTRLLLGDVNGDGNLDSVVFVEFVDQSGVRSTSIAIYLSLGDGAFNGPRFASPTRIGDRDAVVAGELGDWNRDGVVDLFLGWATAGDINLRVLFGGTR
ncbi:MAG: VCBS repeat-containing protein [Planctomycetes bacterium]|nr:VCBS repeat-containing protein [Planctomycetota bacterium]